MSSWRDSFQHACSQRREVVLSPNGMEAVRTLDPHQVEAMDAIVDRLDDVHTKALSIIHSTGSGKTTIEANLLGSALEAASEIHLPGDRLNILLTTERALVTGVRDEIAELGIDTGIWGKGQRQLDRPVIVASIQALQRNTEQLHQFFPLDRTDLVLGDEADLFLTERRVAVIRKFQNALRIGFTATETWPDGRSVSDLWGEKVHELPLDRAILEGINIPPFFHLFEARLDADRLRISGGDYDTASLEAGMRAAEIEKAIPEVYRTLIPAHRRKEFPTLTYVPSRELVFVTLERMREEFAEEGIQVAGWTGLTSNEEMKRDLTAFRAGTLDMLILCEMGGRGLDLPRARCLIDAYPTLSQTKLKQRHGRILRPVREGTELAQSGFQKPYAVLAQIIPHATHFRPVCFPDLLEDPEAWEDVKEGRVLLTERQSNGSLEAVGRPLEHDIREVREWINTHRKNVCVTKLEEVDVFQKLALREQLPQADADGFIRLDGKRYGTAVNWMAELMVCNEAFARRLGNAPSIPGIDRCNRKQDFYEESIIRGLCNDLLKRNTLPEADESGFFELEGKRYGTAYSWSKEWGVRHTSVARQLRDAPAIRGKGRTNNNEWDFYEESVACEKCIGLYERKALPKADETGFFKLGEKRYGTVRKWAIELNISEPTVRSYLADCPFVRGRDYRNFKRNFFEESVVRERCRSFVESQELPEADEGGFFELEGKRYGTLSKWSNEFGSSHHTIGVRLHDCHSILGRDYGGKVCDFYEESLVRERCHDLIKSKELPKADATGFFELRGKRYGMVKSWAKEFAYNEATIVSHLGDCPSIKGRNKRNVQYDFYEESLVCEKCEHLINAQKLPQADETGFFQLGAKRYGTIFYLAKELSVDRKILRLHLATCAFIRGRDSRNRTRNFYEESLVRERCKGLLEQQE